MTFDIDMWMNGAIIVTALIILFGIIMIPVHIWEEKRNDKQPVLTERIRVKRYWQGRGNGNLICESIETGKTRFFRGPRVLNELIYRDIRKNDTGILKYQGTRFISFKEQTF